MFLAMLNPIYYYRLGLFHLIGFEFNFFIYTQRERANGGSVRMAARKESGIDDDTRVTQKTGIQLGG